MKYWVILTALAAMLCACAGHDSGATPSLPVETNAAQSAGPAVDDARKPAIKRCDTENEQPGWVLRGACALVPVAPGGSRLKLPPYSGFAVVAKWPKNDLKSDAFLIGVDATGRGDVKNHRGEAFPLNNGAFLYLKTVNASRAIVFKSQTDVTIDVVGIGLGGSCSIARLGNGGSWKTIATGIGSTSGVDFDIPHSAFPRLPRGVSYYSFTCEASPTPTPSTSPSASPSSGPTTPAPSSSPLTAYCNGISTPVPNGNSSPQKVTFNDQSGSGAQAYLYVITNAPRGFPSTYQQQYLATNGRLTNFAVDATAPPLPLACFPGSAGGTGLTFELPPPPTANQSAFLYIAYATPSPGGGVPNPLSFIGEAAGGGLVGVESSGPYQTTAPYDAIQFTLPSGTTSTSQTVQVGLPMEISQGNTSIGFAPGAYQSVLSGLVATPSYKALAVSSNLNGRNVLSRIVSPSYGLELGFPQDWWYNAAYTGSTYSANDQGYVGYVMSQYQAQPRLYALTGAGGTTPGNYCATSDGTNIDWYFVGQSASCSGTFSGPPMYAMPITSSLEGVCCSGIEANVCAGALIEMGFTPGRDTNSNALYQAMTIDFNRGVALSNSTHPVGGWSTSPYTRPPFSIYYQDPISNTYAKLLHTYMLGHLAAALPDPFDQTGGYLPQFTSVPNETMNVTIQQIPGYDAAPAPTITPFPCP